MTLSKKNKKILYGLMGLVIIIGISMVIMPVFLDKPYDDTTYEKLRYKGENVIVLIPAFTESAYAVGGFYDYYSGECGKECLDIPLNPGRPDKWGTYNMKTVNLLRSLGYPMITDVDAHYYLVKDPDYLNQYDTIILLHSEYITRELYKAITTHQNVIYLAPNALYAEITFDGINMQLVRGHGYPDKSVSNGFDWPHENTPEEYDLDCFMWKFRQVSNGWQLNCVQEIYSQHDPAILLKMRELI